MRLELRRPRDPCAVVRAPGTMPIQNVSVKSGSLGRMKASRICAIPFESRVKAMKQLRAALDQSTGDFKSNLALRSWRVVRSDLESGAAVLCLRAVSTRDRQHFAATRSCLFHSVDPGIPDELVLGAGPRVRRQHAPSHLFSSVLSH